MHEVMAQRRVRVQTVLFNTEPAVLWRLIRGLDATARHAIGQGLVGEVEWALGDSSLAPVFSQADADALAAHASHLAGVTYTFFDANLGSSGGQNRLARDGDGDAEFIWVLNPDTYPSPTALTELVRQLDRFSAAVVDARQIPLEHPKAYDLVTGETSWASGYCMVVRRSVFAAVEGFDSDHFLLHCDDVDFSWRVRAAGHRVLTAPFAAVFHDKRPATDAAWPAPDAEQYHAALGRLMLATRWGRPDIAEETLAAIEASGSSIQRQAVAEFRRRKEAGEVPAPVPDPSPAEFIDGEYAVHRF